MFKKITDITKKVAEGVWTFSLQKGWIWLWAQTEVDEKAKAVIEEIDARLDRAKEESKDVVEAIKDIGEQSKDVIDALKGKTKRRGRPKKKD